MELETVNKLFLELSQFATATTSRELKLESIISGRVDSKHVTALKEVIKFLDHKGMQTMPETVLLRELHDILSKADNKEGRSNG